MKANRVVQHLYNLSQEILRTDVSGMPLEWIDYRDAVRLYHTEQVAYACGTRLYRLFGGTNAKSGLQNDRRGELDHRDDRPHA